MMESDSFEIPVEEENEASDSDSFEIPVEEEKETSESIFQKMKRKKNSSPSKDASASKKKKLNKKKELLKQPTVDEINQLHETETLFHSNMFRLQMEEILDENKMKNKYKKLFNTWFEQLKLVFPSAGDGEGSDEEEEDKTSSENPEAIKPHNIQVIGSFATDTLLGTDVAIDVMVEMPSNWLKKSDYRDYTYMEKVREYSTYIASKIPDELVDSVKFFGNEMKPVLKLVPAEKLGKKLSVNLHVVGRKTKKRLQKFLPDRCNVTNDNDLPTPHYNSLILHDLTMSHANKLNVSKITRYPNVRDAIIMLKIWLKNRQLGNGFDDFNSHVITSYVIYLWSIRAITTYMSSYQIIRHVWHSFVHGNVLESAISLNKDDNIENRIARYKKHHKWVFLDVTGFHNIAAHISEDTFKNVRNMARDSLKCLDETNVSSFAILFMQKVPFYQSFDYLLCVHGPKSLQSVNAKCSEADKVNFGNDEYALVAKSVVRVLKEGLGERISLISVFPRKLSEWETEDEIPSVFEKVLIGLNLNPEVAFNHVMKGPVANLPEAAEFRKYWDGKTELRRFKDGTTCETLIFGNGKTLSSKRLVCRKMISFLLWKKLGLNNEKYFILGTELEEKLRLQKLTIKNFSIGTMCEEPALKAIKTFSELDKNLMSLENLPLPITGVEGLSSVFHYTEVFPPLPMSQTANSDLVRKGNSLSVVSTSNKVPLFVPVLEANIHLSSSGKWPKVLEAVKMTKAAFHLQIAECLRKQCGLKVKCDMEKVTVLKDGFVFQLYIANRKEIALMKEVEEFGVRKYIENQKSIELEKRMVHLPHFNSLLHGLYTRHPSYGPACCLAKRWLLSHMIDESHMPSLVVDLIMASIYLKPSPYQIPNMPQVAFLRFLNLFVENHWQIEPIVVNFNDGLSHLGLSVQELLKDIGMFTAAVKTQILDDD